MGKTVKIPTILNKHFVAARTRVDMSDVDFSKGLEEGYKLMYSKTGLFDNDNLDAFTKKDIKEELRNKKVHGAVTFYWFPENYELTVPWGLGLKDAAVKVNGIAKFGIGEANIKKLIQLPIWEMVCEDDYTMEYLSDYFIDKNGIQNGLSIWFRNELLPVIKEIVEKVDVSSLNKEKLTKAVKDILSGTNDSLLSYGEFNGIIDLNIIKPSQESNNISES